MPQLHFYVPQTVADRIRQQAAASGLSVSQYVAEIVKKELHPKWPQDYLEDVVGGWQGDRLRREYEGRFEERESLNPGDS